MEKNRLEAFSDGVLAIIITIMVLELKVPHGGDWATLKPLLPVFVSYVMSFMFIGVYWGNHHHLLHVVKRVSSSIMLANLHLLFWLSLVPFATGWMGENHFEPFTVAMYGGLMLMCGFSYDLLRRAIENCNSDNARLTEVMRKQATKGWISLAAYASGIPLAYFMPAISVAIFFVVSIMWLIPDKNIERIMNEVDREEGMDV